MSVSTRKLAEFRLWALFVLLGLAFTTAACSSDEGSCEPGEDNYPECLETTG